MRKLSLNSCIDFIIKSKGTIRIKVVGNSMIPELNNNDIITVKKKKEYAVGSIIVFYYSNSLLVHRLIKTDDKYCYCKGDNSFRVEKIEKEQIIGEVILKNNNPIHNWNKWKTDFSFDMYKFYLLNCQDKEKVKDTNYYKLYETIVLDKNYLLMAYIPEDSDEFEIIEKRLLQELRYPHPYKRIVSLFMSEKNTVCEEEIVDLLLKLEKKELLSVYDINQTSS